MRRARQESRVRRDLKKPGDYVAKKPNSKKQPKDIRPSSGYKPEPDKEDLNKPWMSMRSGLILVGLTSVGMAVLTAVQVAPEKGLLQGILYGLLFGVLIWVIFWGFYFFRRFLH